MNSPVQLSKDALYRGKHDRHAFASVPRNPVYIAMDSLTCSHNVGCIFRIADAVLASKVFVCGETHQPPSRKIKKGSRGAEKWVPWEHYDRITDALIGLKESGVEIISVELCHSSVIYSQVSYTSPVCFVLGGEKRGVSPEALALTDRTIYLPMLGMSGSLNVSTAASVVLYDFIQKMGENEATADHGFNLQKNDDS